MEEKQNLIENFSHVPSWIIFCAGLLAAILFYIGGTAMGWVSCDFAWKNRQTEQSINSFEKCVEAGYPILKTYPRQCETPDGKVFISQEDYFKINKETSCSSKSDCILVYQGGFSCSCGQNVGEYFSTGECTPVDLSSDEWIPVNVDWFTNARAQLCPSNINPCPSCNPRPINLDFTTQCVDNVCQKIPK